MKINRVGVDLAKNVFQLHGADHTGKTVCKRRLSRGRWLTVLCDTVEPGTEIGMEACAGAHHWARLLMQRGYPVKIVPSQFVKPFIKSNKKDKLLGISKRGDAYLRCLLVHGARAAVRTAKDKEDRLSRWIVNLQSRRHSNMVAVAMANKMARMAWAMMTKGVDYDPDLAAVSTS